MSKAWSEMTPLEREEYNRTVDQAHASAEPRAAENERRSTPGPWEVIRGWDDDWVICFECRPGEKEQIALATRWPNAEADARLIAAAPDLLANLEFAVKLLQPLLGATAQVEHMQAVVAKAKGQS